MSEKEPPPTPRSKLETLPREDLIRFAKKQAIASKQLKEKNEGLEAKLNELSSQIESLKLEQPSEQIVVEKCETSIQTEPTEENREESQWLRMALSTQQPRGGRGDRSEEIDREGDGSTVQPSIARTAQMDDDSTQTSLKSVVETSAIECQTEEDWIPPPPSKLPPSQGDSDALREAKSQLQLLALELDEARRELASQSLWKLEMEDSERSFVKLQSELKQSSSLLTSAQNENASLRAEIQSMQKRLATSESDREKAEKRSIESDLALETIRRESHLSKLETNEMEIKFGAATKELERMKLDTASDYSSTQRRLCDLQTALDETRRRLEKSENDRVTAEKRLDELNHEYRAYRTRVHSVLKQERTAERASTDDPDDQASNERRLADQQLMASLREQLEKAKQLYETCRCDLERVREQHDQLYERHRMLRTHTDEAEAQWKCELESLRSDAARVARLHAEQVRTLTQDKRDSQRDFERRLDELTAEKKEKAIESEQCIGELERELSWAKQQISEMDRRGGGNKHESGGDLVVGGKDETARRRAHHADSTDLTSPRPMAERKPGEGAENADVIKKSSYAVSIATSDFQLPYERQRSLEDLLGDQQSVHSFDASSLDHRPSTAIRDESASALAKLSHLSELLSESEANNSRLSEQIKLLKDEIRRLERNNERSEHVANAEYLKNIVMQFLNPTMQDRRQRLLPVLTTLLRLSPEEVATLKDTTAENQQQPGAAAASNATGSSGWSGYIHRWSGLN